VIVATGAAPEIDETHDPARKSFVASANGHPDFPIQNLPFGVFRRPGLPPRGGVAIGDQILDLSAAAASPLLDELARDAALAGSGETLNPLLALAPLARRALRRRLSELLLDSSDQSAKVATWLWPADACELGLPAAIGDYTDFYAGIHHAVKIGRQFRPDAPLLPNYKHVPIGYHGRASSVRASGASVRRPNGQRKGAPEETPTFGASQRLDLELELGVWIGGGNPPGEPILIDVADQHIAGLCLLNDWSARDIQAWEYQPLGPFLAKNFATTISPWIVTAEALAPFRIAHAPRPAEDPKPLPYLWSERDQATGAYAIALEISLQSEAMRRQGVAPVTLSRSAARHLYWTLAQLVTHHTSGGCNLRPGDLLGTGTISTPDDSGHGSLMELTRNGQAPLTLPTGETRAFLEDGDELSLSGRAVAEGFVPIGFGPCVGVITAAPPL